MPKRSKEKKRGNKFRVRTSDGQPTKAELKKLLKQHGNTNRVAESLGMSWQQTDKLLRTHGLKEDKVKNPPSRKTDDNDGDAPMGKREVARAVREALGVKTFPQAVRLMEEHELLPS